MLKKKYIVLACGIFCGLALVGSVAGMAITGALKAGSADLVTATTRDDDPAQGVLQQLPHSPGDLGDAFILPSGDTAGPQASDITAPDITGPNTPEDGQLAMACLNPWVIAGGKVMFALDKVESPRAPAEAFTLLGRPGGDSKALLLTGITMPAFQNAGGVTYMLYIKTDKNPGWRAHKSTRYDAATAIDIMFSGLENDERVTEVKWDFGAVPSGFGNRSPIQMQFTASRQKSDYAGGNAIESTARLSFTAAGRQHASSAQAQTRVMPDAKHIIKVPGNDVVTPGQDVTYTIAGFENNSASTYYGYAIDDIPQAGIQFRHIEMPAFTGGAGVGYSVLYRTDLNASWRPMATGLSAAEAHGLAAPSLGVNERFTGIRVFFEQAPAGFGAGDYIRLTFTVTAEASLFETHEINNQAWFSIDSLDEPASGSPAAGALIEIAEDDVPYAPITVRNPLTVTGGNGVAPLYWILAVLILALGMGTVLASLALGRRRNSLRP